MTFDEALNQVDDFLAELSDEDLIELWNTYCEEISDVSREIHYMEDLDEVLNYTFKLSPSDILNSVIGTDFDLSDYYFNYDAINNDLSSFDDIVDGPYDFSELRQYIVEGNHSLGDSYLEDILDEIEDEE